MSTRQTGNRYENEAAEQLQAAGYWTFAARGSRTAIDLLAIHRETKQIVAVQVGTKNKSYRKALLGMYVADKPFGTVCIVARRIYTGPNTLTRWSWHFDSESTSWTERPDTAIYLALKEAA